MAIGQLILSIVNVIKLILKPFISLILAIILLTLGLTWTSSVIAFLGTLPLVTYFGPSPGIFAFFGSISIFLTITIPMLWLMFFITRWFSPYRLPKQYSIPMRYIWIGSLIFSFITVFNIAMEHTHYANIENETVIEPPSNELLITAIDQPLLSGASIFKLPHMTYTKKGLVMDHIRVNIEKSKDQKIRIIEKRKATGPDDMSAKARAASIESETLVSDNVLSLPQYFVVEKGSRFNNQDLDYTIQIPEGIHVKIDPSIENQLNKWAFRKNNVTPRSLTGYDWVMSSEGMSSVEWNEEYFSEVALPFNYSPRLDIDLPANVDIIQGQKPSIVVKGPKEQIKKIASENTSNGLYLSAPSFSYQPVQVLITTPSIDELMVQKVKKLSLRGFEQDNMTIIFDSEGYMDASLDVDQLDLTISNYGEVDLSGSGDKLHVDAMNGAKLSADKFKVNEAHLKGRIYRSSSLYIQDKCVTDLEEYQRPKIFGNPEFIRWENYNAKETILETEK